MNYKFSILTLLIFNYFNSSYAQNRDFELGDKTPIQVNYYGNLLVHPGFSLGIDWNLCQNIKQITKEKNDKSKTIRTLYGLNPTLSFYNHYQSHTSLIAGVSVFRRRYSKRLFFRQIDLGFSYERRFNDNETFEVSDDGVVTNIGRASRGYLGNIIGVSGGKRFTLNENLPVEAFAGIQTRVNYGYSAGISLDANVQIGFRIFPNWGIKRGLVATKMKQITR